MELTREEMMTVLQAWYRCWNQHDLGDVMALFDEDIRFENWTGATVVGKTALQKAWTAWFADHGRFRFEEEETFVDVEAQKALYRWTLQWPSFEKGFENQAEKRRGVDVLHFKNGKIVAKLTYSKTTLEIEGKRYRMSVGDPS